MHSDWIVDLEHGRLLVSMQKDKMSTRRIEVEDGRKSIPRSLKLGSRLGTALNRKVVKS